VIVGVGPRPDQHVQQQGNAHATGKLRLDRVAVGEVMRTDGMTMLGFRAAEAGRWTARHVVRDDDRDGAGVLGVLDLHSERARPPIHQAILPATAAALVIGEQASVVLGPATSAASRAATEAPRHPVDVIGAPNAAAPTA